MYLTAYLFEQRSFSFDLGRDLFIKESLRQDLNSLMLPGNAQFLYFLVNINRAGVAILLSPTAELTVRTVRVLVTVVIAQVKAGHATLCGLGASSNGFSGRIDRPVILLDGRLGLDVRSLADEFSQLILITSVSLVIESRRRRVSVSAVVSRAVTARSFLGLALLRVLRRVLEDECGQLVPHIDIGPLAASFAVANDGLVPRNKEVGLGVLARLAQYESVDEAVK